MFFFFFFFLGFCFIEFRNCKEFLKSAKRLVDHIPEFPSLRAARGGSALHPHTDSSNYQ